MIKSIYSINLKLKPRVKPLAIGRVIIDKKLQSNFSYPSIVIEVFGVCRRYQANGVSHVHGVPKNCFIELIIFEVQIRLAALKVR